MNFVETTGKTVDEAIAQALIQLGVPSDQVNIEVLDEGSKGIVDSVDTTPLHPSCFDVGQTEENTQNRNNCRKREERQDR